MKYLVALSLIGCAPASLEVEKPPEVVEAPGMSPLARAVLQSAAVTHDSFARRVLYTWTSDAGAARLRKERRLLVPTEKEGLFVEQVEALAQGVGALSDFARLLATHPSLSARRYAWTRPFATRVPLADRSYGSHLVSVVLKRNAILARFDLDAPVPVELVDLDGEPIPLGHVLRDPSRLAAIYHVGRHPTSGDRFREYVLVNESMIAEWSMGTDAIAEVVSSDLATVHALQATALPDVAAAPRWQSRSDKPEDLYPASLAFDTERHRPTRKNLADLEARLRELAPDEPLVVNPTDSFIVLGPKPPKVPALPRGFGVKPRIYDCS